MAPRTRTHWNQIAWARRLIVGGTALCAVIAHIAIADSVSIRALDNGADPFPESRFGAKPYRERESRAYRETAIDRAPGGSPSGGEFLPERRSLGDRVGEVDSVEDRAPGSVSVVAPIEQMRVGQRAGVQEVAVIANDLGYFPKTVFVNPGVPVRLYVTSASRQSLCIMMDSFHIRRQIKSMRMEEIAFTPSAAGKFRFYCPVNGMEGTLVVREIVRSGE